MDGTGQASRLDDGVVSGRLSAAEVADNFQDLHPSLGQHEALVAADRCYFCHDAPCMTACPTAIDIPMFIRQIAADNPIGAAKTIFDQNILGGMCARVCPTETLCEEACVREVAEGEPVRIGLLQRFATDHAMSAGRQFYARGAESGKSVAIIGAGPAGLACAHRLAMRGHNAVIYEARNKPGGLNEFGIAAYKTVDGFAQSEIAYLTAIGGIEIRHGEKLGESISLASLREDYDAVFLGMGLAGVNGLGFVNADAEGVADAVEFIARLRQTEDKSAIPVGRNIVVIGGGMTAIDAAVQAKLIGAETVTICYRRGQAQMNASAYEQELAAAKGVVIRTGLQPKRFVISGGALTGVELEYTEQTNGAVLGTGRVLELAADQVFLAIGQTLLLDGLAEPDARLDLDGRRINTDEEGRTSLSGVWAGGDCTNSGEDLTVAAVAQGRDAAESIHSTLSA